MQSSLRQRGFSFLPISFLPNLTLCQLFCLWATPCPVQPLFPFPWLRRAGSSSVPPEQGSRSHLQLRAAVQLLPSSYQTEWMKPINNNPLFPDPFQRFVNTFKLSHSSSGGHNPLWQMQAWGSISVCPQSKWTQHCEAAEQNPLLFSDRLLTGSALLSGSRSTQCCCSSKQGATGTNWSRGSSSWTWGRTSSLWGWRSPGTGRPGRLWSLLLWRYSRPTWTRSYAACSGWPCLGRRVGLGDPQRSLPTPTILLCWFFNNSKESSMGLVLSFGLWVWGFLFVF